MDVRAAPEPPHNIDIADQVRELTLRQHRMEKRLSTLLGTDVAGFDVMSHLISTGPTTPTELARHLGISTAATTLVLHRLEAAGHISRERHATDGRRLLIRPLETSVERVSRQIAPFISAVEQVASTLDAEQRRTITDFLDQVIACYDRTIQGLGSH